MQTELKHEIRTRMVDTLVNTFVRILISILSFVVISIVLPQFIDFDISDMLDSPDEKENKKHGKEIVNDLENKLGRKLPELTSHETQIASTIYYADQEFGFDSLGGLSEIKHDLKHHYVTALKNPDVFFHNEMLRPPNMLLTGSPGVGKTRLVKALSAETGVPMILFSLSTVESKYVGESQKLLSAVFSLANKLESCIIFFDEIDSVIRQRNALEQAHEYNMKTSLLQHLDGISNNQNGVVVIGATNHPQSLDTAIHRRFPRKYEVPLPDDDSRRSILNILTSKHGERKAPEYIIEETDGMSGSDLTELFRRACSLRNETITQSPALIESLRNGLKIPKIKLSHWRKALELQTNSH